jgi:hypothetical protein
MQKNIRLTTKASLHTTFPIILLGLYFRIVGVDICRLTSRGVKGMFLRGVLAGIQG